MSGRGPRGPAGPRGQAGPGRGAAAATRVAGPPRGLAGTGGLRLLCPAAGGPGATRVAVATALTTELVVPGQWLTRARRRTGQRRRGLPLPAGVRPALPAPQRARLGSGGCWHLPGHGALLPMSPFTPHLLYCFGVFC